MNPQNKLTVDRSDRQKLYLGILILLVLVGAALRVVNLGGVVNRSPDERTYTWESNAIAEHGTEGFRSLVKQFQNDPSLFTWPSPARAGYLWILSWVIHISGHHDPYAGAMLACFSSIGSLILLGVIGWRLLGPLVALASTLLYAVTPPVLAMARRSWQESFAECLALLLFFLALEAAREESSWWWAAGAGVVAGLSISIKEMAVVHAALIVILLGIALVRRSSLRQFYVLAASATISAAICCAWLAYLFGGFLIFIEFVRQGVAVTGTAPYALTWQSGSVVEWFYLLWTCDPVIFTLGTIGIALALWQTSKSSSTEKSQVLLWASLVVLIFLIIPVLSPHHFNIRFIFPIFGPLCLLAGVAVHGIGGVLDRLLHGNEALWTKRFALAVLLCAAFVNYRAFQERFVHTDLQDLSFKMIQESSDGR